MASARKPIGAIGVRAIKDAPRSSIERTHLTTSDPDELAAFLRRAYVDHHRRPRTVGEGHRHGGRHRSRLARGIALAAGAADTTLGLDTDTGPFHAAVVQVVHAGHLYAATRDEELPLTPGEVVLYRPGRPYRLRWDQVRATGLTMPMKAIEDMAHTRSDLDPGALRFEQSTPASTALGAYWARVSGFVVRELLADDTALADPLVAAQVRRFVADAMLTVFPNTTTAEHYQPSPGAVAPAALRRAVAYLEEHAGRPVTLDEIAAAAGTRPRAVQYAFRRHYDTTPIGFLRRLRLERAHRDLQAADPARGDTITAIAHRWGYANPASFAAAYHRAYGMPPSRTLRT
ncbi:AraC family transcriptional regulator [Tomitella cavernea]|uniref:HTH araC/xylS-type domain-containing protein n=1 Tax=Tomitella cavernea TaxID=1387982 RepID=A0ABP9D6A0_9ACTN|nr:AraC family transcriptional regulator [Tomitella cavernea]